MRKLSLLLALLFALLISSVAAAAAFPDRIPLPNGFQPEGIASGAGTDFYVGSLVDGSIYKGDLRTGEGAVWVQGAAGRVAVGLAYDALSGYLFVAGGPTGSASVYDTRTGELVQTYQFTTANSFVNDVIVTRAAAWFTDSANAQLYVLPLGPGGAAPAAGDFQTLPLGGEWQQGTGFNANGIEAAPNGDALIVVNSGQGRLYRVHPTTGEAAIIDLGGEVLTAGDGLLLEGKTLYVVRNRLNQIAVVQLADDLRSGALVETITSDAFRVPTTIARHGSSLYAVNARFGAAGQNLDYGVVRVRK
jgi:sugar lactone lactonase YvrE